MGAYCKPRCAQAGKVQGVSEIKKKDREITVITAIQNIVHKVLVSA
jgi:hypothetical protein